MTLGRLMLAWVVVVVWFVVATVATDIVVTRSMPPLGLRNRALVSRLIEAGLLTLLASLWFDSLGSGEWWLLFLLIGALVAIPAWFRDAPLDVPRRVVVENSLAHLVRYLIAGALLAWRLS